MEVKILNSKSDFVALEKNLVFAARLTQRGHSIKDMSDVMSLYDKPYSEDVLRKLLSLPHPTIQKFGTIEIVLCGISRRFLTQITRHQNEVKFMSTSLQYSDYSKPDIESMSIEDLKNIFYVPSNLMVPAKQFELVEYLHSCKESFITYSIIASDADIGNDSAGYLMPQALMGTLLISATPYQWKHMIEQRVCKRNTPEMVEVMTEVATLLGQCSVMFEGLGPACAHGTCPEGTMSCRGK